MIQPLRFKVENTRDRYATFLYKEKLSSPILMFYNLNCMVDYTYFSKMVSMNYGIKCHKFIDHSKKFRFV